MLCSCEGEGSSLVEDSMQCLRAIASHPLGLEHILTNDTLQALAGCLTNQQQQGTRMSLSSWGNNYNF